MVGAGQMLPIGIEPKIVFGFRPDVIGNIHFTSKDEVIYPVSGVLAIHDYTRNKQKFLRFPEKCKILMTTISPNKKLLAIAERFKDEKIFINIYDIEFLRKRKTIEFPNEISTKEVASMSFTYNSKGFVILSKEPDSHLIVIYFDENDTIVFGRVSNSSHQLGIPKCIACNPNDAGLIAVGGEYIFKYLNKTEKGLTPVGTIKGDGIIITSMTWISNDVLIAGSNKSMLYIVEGGDLKTVLNAVEVNFIDLSKIREIEEEEKDDKSEKSNITVAVGINSEHYEVIGLLQFAKGFAYALHNAVHVFQKESAFEFKKKTIIEIPVDLYENHLYKITNMAVNTSMDTILVSTIHSQIYLGVLLVPESLALKNLTFQTLGEPLHIDSIISLSVCAWKPIIMTASKDQTIRIWNYLTGKVELVKKYQVDISVVALHPSGIFVAVGFLDQFRLMEILLDDLKVIKNYNYPKSRVVEFSHKGHLLAMAYEKLIIVLSVFSFEILQVLKGHNGSVLSLGWSYDDIHLISAGIEGAVYQWNTTNGNRIYEVVQKGIEYRNLNVTNEANTAFVITNTGVLREITKSEILREVKIADQLPLTTSALSRSDLILFVGNESGHLYNVQLPFMEHGGGTCTSYRFFSSSITKMRITYDDSFLVTASADGTLIIWKILNNEGKMAQVDQKMGRCGDILISRQDLLGKIDLISSLETRMIQQITEFEYQLKQEDIRHKTEVEELKNHSMDVINDLKSKNENMETAHIEELNIITTNILKTKDDHQKALMELETEFRKKIIVEFEKSTAIKKQMDEMREEYEIKLRKSAGCLQDTIESLETDFKKQLQDRQNLIRQLMNEIEEKKIEFMEYCRSVNDSNYRQLANLKLDYENKLQQEEETSNKWRSEAGILLKKFNSLTKSNNKLKALSERLENEHNDYKNTIKQYEKDMDNMREEVRDRDITIKEKDKRVNELQHQNQDLEKYKLILTHKITELKLEIEPREKEIKECKDQILDMEHELEQLQQNNLQLELQVNELKDKYQANEINLKNERTKLRASKAFINRICGDIFQLSNYIQNPNKLKIHARQLFQRYAENTDYESTLALEADVKNEFIRQREHIEKFANVSKSTKQATCDFKEHKDFPKLMKENVLLQSEINQLKEYKQKKEQLDRGGSKKKSLGTISKSDIVVNDYDERIEQNRAIEIEMLEGTIRELKLENEKLRAEKTL